MGQDVSCVEMGMRESFKNREDTGEQEPIRGVTLSITPWTSPRPIPD